MGTPEGFPPQAITQGVIFSSKGFWRGFYFQSGSSERMAHFKTLKFSACEGATEHTDNTYKKKTGQRESHGPGTQE